MELVFDNINKYNEGFEGSIYTVVREEFDEDKSFFNIENIRSSLLLIQNTLLEVSERMLNVISLSEDIISYFLDKNLDFRPAYQEFDLVTLDKGERTFLTFLKYDFVELLQVSFPSLII